MGLNAALATAARSLELFSAGIQVAGQNIANANTPDYVREKLNVSTNLPYRQGNLIYGTGSLASGIRQQIDKYLEVRLNTASTDYSGAQTRSTIYKQLETLVNEFSDSDLSTGVNNFLATIQNVANQPELLANRQIAVRQGVQLTDQIKLLRSQVDFTRDGLNTNVKNLVQEANQLIDQISKLNPQIIAAESAGLLASDAGGLRSQRYAAIQRLSEIIPIRTVEQPNTQVDVFLGNEYLVLDGSTRHLETQLTTDRGIQTYNAQVEGTHTVLSGTGGELNGVISGRDQILGGFVDQLDQYTGTLINEFNRLFSSGTGLKGYTSVTGTYGVTNAGAALNAAGLPFAPQHGSFEVKVLNTSTGETNSQVINVDLDGIGADTTLNSLQAALGGIANITANVTTDGRLTLTAANGYEIQFGNDTSGALAALGINTFFQGTDSSNIGINATVQGDSRLFAAGLGGGSGDSSNAVRLAQFTDQPLAVFGGQTLNQQYDAIVAQLGQQSAVEESLAKGLGTFKDSLTSQRAQSSGVSLDEEAIQVLSYQRSYQAAAKFVSTIDELYQILLNF